MMAMSIDIGRVIITNLSVGWTGFSSIKYRPKVGKTESKQSFERGKEQDENVDSWNLLEKLIAFLQ